MVSGVPSGPTHRKPLQPDCWPHTWYSYGVPNVRPLAVAENAFWETGPPVTVVPFVQALVPVGRQRMYAEQLPGHEATALS